MQLTPAKTSLGGASVMAACACGAGASTAKLLNMAGVPATARITHPTFLGIGGLLILVGLWQVNRRAAAIAAGGLVTLIAAAALTPPLMMSAAHEPWHGAQLAGAVLYLVFAAAMGVAFLTAFPAPKRLAANVAMTGTLAATGCTCCMVTGAIAGLAVSFGGAKSVFLANPTIFFSGIAVAAVGLAMIRGVRPLPWLAAGAIVTRWGGDALKLLGDWKVGDVNLRFIPGYVIYLVGAGLVMTAWAVAYEPVRRDEPAPAAGDFVHA